MCPILIYDNRSFEKRVNGEDKREIFRMNHKGVGGGGGMDRRGEGMNRSNTCRYMFQKIGKGF